MKYAYPKSFKTGEQVSFKTAETAVFGADGLTTADHISELQRRTSSNTSSISVERARIDNLIAESTENTVNNAELIDIRTGQDSVVYTSAGEAIRGQFLNVFNAIKEITKYTKNAAPENINIYDIITSNDDKTELYTDYVSFPSICQVSVPNDYLVKVVVYEYTDGNYNFIHTSDWVSAYAIPRDLPVIIQLKHIDSSVITNTEIVALSFLYEHPSKQPSLENAGFYSSLQYEYESTDIFAIERISSSLIWNEKPLFVTADAGYQCCILSFSNNNDGTFTKYFTYEWADTQFIPAKTPCIISFRKESNTLILLDEFINNFKFTEIHHNNVFLNNVFNTLSFTGVVINTDGSYTYGNSTGRLLSSVLTSDVAVTLYVTDIASTTKLAYHLIDNDVVVYDSQWSTMITIPANMTVRVFIKDDNEIINPECIYDIAIKDTTDITSNPFIKDIAHRGLSKYAPENTLVAFKYAKLQGFKYVECDIKFTSDGVPVILHDETIDRTARTAAGDAVTGNIADLTFDQVRQYDFGYWFREAPTGIKIPTFDEFIRFCKKNGLHPYIHIDISLADTSWSLKIDNLIDRVLWFNMIDNVTWISFTPDNLQRIKARIPTSRLGLLPTGEVNQTTIDYAIALRTDHQGEVFIDASSFSSDEVNLCRTNGFPLELWTIDDINRLTNIEEYYSGITSNSIQVGKLFIKDEYITE